MFEKMPIERAMMKMIKTTAKTKAASFAGDWCLLMVYILFPVLTSYCGAFLTLRQPQATYFFTSSFEDAATFSPVAGLIK
jgi:uncharacterized membrane protein (DUF485 family)